MQFSVLLNIGAEPQRCEANGADICLETAQLFVNECLSLIGCNGTITKSLFDDLSSQPTIDGRNRDCGGLESLYDFESYIFIYNEKEFSRFERFLFHLPLEFIRRHKEGLTKFLVDESGFIPVLEYFICLLSMWKRANDELNGLSIDGSMNRFAEPLARINMKLLTSVHQMRKLYRSELGTIDNVCVYLFNASLPGIHYPRSHAHIIESLLQMFHADFDILIECSPNSLNVFFEALSVHCQRPKYKLVYKTMTDLLTTIHQSQSNYLILTNFLVEKRMIQIYFTALKQKYCKTYLMALLNFLRTLQSVLLSLDCFTQLFVEAILIQVFNSDCNISSLAADIYISIMQRQKCQNENVLNHMLQFYLRTRSSPAVLTHYVRTFWLVFPYIQKVEVYLSIITNEEADELTRLMATHFLYTVAKEMLNNNALHLTNIQQLLLCLPSILQQLGGCEKSGILLQIYELIDFPSLKFVFASFAKIVESFEKYAFNTFLHSTTLEYPFLLNIFTQWDRVLQCSHHWPQLEQATVHIMNAYLHAERSLDQLTTVKTTQRYALLREYGVLLKKLSIMLQTRYALFDSTRALFQTLKLRLIHTQQIDEYVAETHMFIDVYAIDILNLLITSEHNSIEEINITSTDVKQLEDFLIARLLRLQQLAKVPIVRLQATFCCLVGLYKTFHQTTGVYILNCNGQYPKLVQTLLVTCVERCIIDLHDGDEVTMRHPQRIAEYQHLMFRHFISLHTHIAVKIETNSVWKLCQYYGVHSHDFTEDLAALLTILAKHRFGIFQHVVPVVIFNLNKKPQRSDREIINAIKKHNELIDTKLHLPNAATFKVHIILTVLDLLQKSVYLTPIKGDVNRLLQLKHLNAFLENVNLSAENIKDTIVAQAQRIRDNLLTSNEHKSLNEYLHFFKALN